ncbi:uncharacterized protein METZ01_LOCUS325929 [marine metagenome]|uniref:7-cyano-7-deazaguanine synthase n=1 Tax=marine metagenome TaxID=408172 RepID=A0A382PK82_9ZZZZ
MSSRCFVLFSGGIESVALLHWLVEHENYDPIAVHSVFEHPVCSSRKLNANIEQITDHYKVPLLIHKQSAYQFDFGETTEYFHSAKHWILAACSVATRYPNVKNYFYGANSGIWRYGEEPSDFHYHDRTWEFYLIFEHYATMMHGRDHGQKIYPPLSGLTKRAQWDSLPENIQELTQSCGKPMAFDGKSPCGKCSKCLEYQSMRGGIKPV